VKVLKTVKDSKTLTDLQHELLPPQHAPADFEKCGIHKLKDVEKVEFSHSFYQEAFRDSETAPEKLSLMKLRLCAFLDLHDEQISSIPFD